MLTKNHDNYSHQTNEINKSHYMINERHKFWKESNLHENWSLYSAWVKKNQFHNLVKPIVYCVRRKKSRGLVKCMYLKVTIRMKLERKDNFLQFQNF